MKFKLFTLPNIYYFTVTLIIYEFTTYMGNDILIPAVLDISRDFHSTLFTASLPMSLYILGDSIGTLSLMVVAQYVNQRKLLLFGATIFILCNVLLGLSSNFIWFSIIRIIQGSSLSFITIGYLIIQIHFNDKDMIKLFSMMLNFGLLAPLCGPIIGAWLLHSFGWRSIFFFLCILSIIPILGFYYSSTMKSINTNTPLKLKQLFINCGNILKNRQFILGCLCIAITHLPFLIWISLGSILIIHVAHLSLDQYVLYQIISMIGFIISCFISQILAGKISFSSIVSSSTMLSFIGLLISYIFRNNILMIVLGITIYNIGLGLLVGIVNRLILKVIPLYKNIVSTLFVFIETLSWSLLLIFSNIILNYLNYSFSGFTLYLIILACIFLIINFIYAHSIRNILWD